MLKNLFIALLILIGNIGFSQVMPQLDARLNYRLVGFKVTKFNGATSYVFHVTKGSPVDKQKVKETAFIHSKVATDSTIILVPSFAMSYTWYVSYVNVDGKELAQSPLYKFSVGESLYADTLRNGIFVMTNTKKHDDIYLLSDRVLVIYDMHGSPIWYMPDIPELKERDITIRDFKPTNDGTFTFMTKDDAIEVDYDGRVVWKAPNDGKVSGTNSESYHHEFTKLSNGHYIVASAEIILRQIPGTFSDYFSETDTTVVKGRDGAYYKQITCGTLIEYDKEGNVVWKWKASEHLIDSDYFRLKKSLLVPYSGNTYMNAFEFDEIRHVVYISFKNINRILKIAYPSGQVLDSYGENLGKEGDMSPFYGQHSCRINPRTGYMYLYNNNHNEFEKIHKWQLDNDGYITSHVEIYKQPENNMHMLKKIWDFPCKLTVDKSMGQVTIRGGSVSILPDDCILVNMGTMNHMMIVNKNMQLEWDAAPYTTDGMNKKMAMIPYRCNYLNKKDIPKFVFGKG